MIFLNFSMFSFYFKKLVKTNQTLLRLEYIYIYIKGISYLNIFGYNIGLWREKKNDIMFLFYFMIFYISFSFFFFLF